jgi:NADH dehydrogenase FAD-containing subunit
MEHIVIIGNGIAGVTLARHIRKQSKNKITIISSETEFFSFENGIDVRFMGHMKFEHATL